MAMWQQLRAGLAQQSGGCATQCSATESTQGDLRQNCKIKNENDKFVAKSSLRLGASNLVPERHLHSFFMLSEFNVF
jgi:hypothetical protein